MQTVATVLQWTLIVVIVGLCLRYGQNLSGIIQTFGSFWTNETGILAKQ